MGVFIVIMHVYIYIDIDIYIYRYRYRYRYTQVEWITEIFQMHITQVLISIHW